MCRACGAAPRRCLRRESRSCLHGICERCSHPWADSHRHAGASRLPACPAPRTTRSMTSSTLVRRGVDRGTWRGLLAWGCAPSMICMDGGNPGLLARHGAAPEGWELLGGGGPRASGKAGETRGAARRRHSTPQTLADRDTRRAHLPGGHIKLNYHDFSVTENAKALDVRGGARGDVGGVAGMGAGVLAWVLACGHDGARQRGERRRVWEGCTGLRRARGTGSDPPSPLRRAFSASTAEAVPRRSWPAGPVRGADSGQAVAPKDDAHPRGEQQRVRQNFLRMCKSGGCSLATAEPSRRG